MNTTASTQQSEFEGKSVRELQELAARQSLRIGKTRRKNSISRAGQLHLIDVLSRWSGAGLGAIAGVTIFLAVTIGQAMPLRAAVWSSLVLIALYYSRRLRRDFRAGGKVTAHPFRWRANYTSSLCVLGATFGAGAYLLTPEGINNTPYLTYFLLLGATLFAAGLHSAHAFSAAAIAVPSLTFVIAGAWRGLDISLALSGLIGLSSLGLLGVYFIASAATNQANKRFPRSGFVRHDAIASETAKKADAPDLPTTAASA